MRAPPTVVACDRQRVSAFGQAASWNFCDRAKRRESATVPKLPGTPRQASWLIRRTARPGSPLADLPLRHERGRLFSPRHCSECLAACSMAPCLNRIRRNRHGDHQFPQQNKVEAVMRITIAAVVLFLISGNCFAQSSVGGGSSGAAAGGGSAGSSAVAAPAGRGAGSIAPTVPGNGITPIPRAPGVANTPVDPQRNNVDAQPPTRRLPGSTATEPRGPG
jgi:hypothetical protein